MDMKRVIAIILALFAVVLIIAGIKSEKNETILPNETDWNTFFRQYRDVDQVRQLIFVQYTGGSSADVLCYRKNSNDGNSWSLFLETNAYVGINGIAERKKDGDGRTPKGDFPLTGAFGIRSNPGTGVSYTQITPDLYYCTDNVQEYYNTLIIPEGTGHKCSGVHMSDYSPEYNYGMIIGSNPKCKYPNGSAIFLCCKGAEKYTTGSIALDEYAVVSILQTVSEGARIIIYEK